MPDLEAYDVNRKLLYDGLTEIGYECVKPDGAFYLFVKTPGGENSVFCEKAKAKNLLVVPSEPFGVEGYFRLGYCVSKEMIERALPVFREVFEELESAGRSDFQLCVMIAEKRYYLSRIRLVRSRQSERTK